MISAWQGQRWRGLNAIFSGSRICNNLRQMQSLTSRAFEQPTPSDLFRVPPPAPYTNGGRGERHDRHLQSAEGSMLAHIAPSVISEQIRIVSQSPNFVRNTVSRRGGSFTRWRQSLRCMKYSTEPLYFQYNTYEFGIRHVRAYSICYSRLS